MKLLLASRTLPIPDGISIEVKGRAVRVKVGRPQEGRRPAMPPALARRRPLLSRLGFVLLRRGHAAP
jgi:hypothetical protein